VPYDLIQHKVTRPSELEILPFSKSISSAILQYELANDY